MAVSATTGETGSVTVEVNGNAVAASSIRVGSSGTIIPLDLTALKASSESYDLQCTVQIGEETFRSKSELWYLPQNPHGGSTVKIDRLSGALMTQREWGWEKIVPFGWYDVSIGWSFACRGLSPDLLCQRQGA